MPIKYIPASRKSTNIKIINKQIVNKSKLIIKRAKAWPTSGMAFSSATPTLQNKSNIYTNVIRKIPSSCTQLYSKYVSSGSLTDYTNYINCYNTQYPNSITSVQKSNDILLNKQFTADGTINTFPSKCNSMICDWLYKSKTSNIQKGYNNIPEYNNVDECGTMLSPTVLNGSALRSSWMMPQGISSGITLNPVITKYY
jgi:hypothetical protein